MRPLRRPAVLKHRKELAKLLEGVAGLAIAGGHVATLLNRLELFGIAELLGDKPVFAWSAGRDGRQSERVVLFHDDPPQGRGASPRSGARPVPWRAALSSARGAPPDRRQGPDLPPGEAPRAADSGHPDGRRAHHLGSRVLYRPYKVQRLHEDGSVENLG
jgi:hypothetical protein